MLHQTIKKVNIALKGQILQIPHRIIDKSVPNYNTPKNVVNDCYFIDKQGVIDIQFLQEKFNNFNDFKKLYQYPVKY